MLPCPPAAARRPAAPGAPPPPAPPASTGSGSRFTLGTTIRPSALGAPLPPAPPASTAKKNETINPSPALAAARRPAALNQPGPPAPAPPASIAMILNPLADPVPCLPGVTQADRAWNFRKAFSWISAVLSIMCALPLTFSCQKKPNIGRMRARSYAAGTGPVRQALGGPLSQTRSTACSACAPRLPPRQPQASHPHAQSEAPAAALPSWLAPDIMRSEPDVQKYRQASAE